MKPEKKLTIDEIKEIGLTYHEIGSTKLGEKFGVSRKKVHRIVCELRKKGMIIPRVRSEKALYQQVIDELKISNPEKFRQGN